MSALLPAASRAAVVGVTIGRRASGTVAAAWAFREAPIVAVDGSHRRREKLLVRHASSRARLEHRFGIRAVAPRLPARLDIS